MSDDNAKTAAASESEELAGNDVFCTDTQRTDDEAAANLIRHLENFDAFENVEPVELPPIASSVAFSCGNPAVEVFKGIIRLFNKSDGNTITHSSALPAKRSNILCVINIPNWLSIGDLINFFGSHYLDKINGIRILQSDSSTHYMTAIKAKSQEYADQIYTMYNGRVFSSMSESDTPNRCIMTFLKQVDFLNYPENNDILTDISGLFPDISSYKQIPTCPVCLERLDASVTGLFTLLCNHTLHSNCLSKWYLQEIRCPVCRHIAKPSTPPNTCLQCGAESNLWICLLCGNIGCSRYQESHAKLHFLSSHHNYALELNTQRVWDYAGDGYVHRIIQNKVDGKLVEFPSPNACSDYRTKNDDTEKDELDETEAISLEYQYLITAQLDTQRAFFEQKMRDIDSFRVKQLRKLEIEQDAWKLKEKEFNQKIKKLSTQLVNFKTENERLAEQVKDLMLHIEGQKIIARDEGKLVDGQVLTFTKNKANRKKKHH